MEIFGIEKRKIGDYELLVWITTVWESYEEEKTLIPCQLCHRLNGSIFFSCCFDNRQFALFSQSNLCIIWDSSNFQTCKFVTLIGLTAILLGNIFFINVVYNIRVAHYVLNPQIASWQKTMIQGKKKTSPEVGLPI
jgi:hypothetical protein